MSYYAKSNISHNGATYTAGQEVPITDEDAALLVEDGVLTTSAPTETETPEEPVTEPVVDEEPAPEVPAEETPLAPEPTDSASDEAPVIQDVKPKSSAQPTPAQIEETLNSLENSPQQSQAKSTEEPAS